VSNSTKDSSPVGFEVGLSDGWAEIETVQSEAPDPGRVPLTAWSLKLAGQGEGGAQRLGIFISVDASTLLKLREWPMMLEQEIAKVRDRANRILRVRKNSK
jgi:hypothetical protein